MKRFEVTHDLQHTTRFVFQRGAGERMLVAIECLWPVEGDPDPLAGAEHLVEQLATLPPVAITGSLPISFPAWWSVHDEQRYLQAGPQIAQALQSFPAAREIVVDGEHRYAVRRG